MNDDSTNRPCPRRTPWCTQHEPESNLCGSTALSIEGSSCAVWLIQDAAAVEPVIVVDVVPGGSYLTLVQGSELSDAILHLRSAARTGMAVQW